MMILGHRNIKNTLLYTQLVNFLAKYCGVRKMKVVLNGRKVGNGDIAVYFENKAYFKKRADKTNGVARIVPSPRLR